MSKGFVIVTGAGSGIGRASALALDEAGYRVIACVRDAAEAERLHQHGDANAGIVTFDVVDREAVARGCAEALELVGSDQLAAVVNSAGVVIAGPMIVLPDEDLRRQFDINVFGLMDVTRTLGPRLIQDRGRIINVGSVGGRLSVPWTGAYSASKFALRAITDALRFEISSRGVKVSLIEPGPIKTEIWDTSLKFGDHLREKLGDEFEREYGADADKLEIATREAQGRASPVERVAKAILHAVSARRPKPNYLIGTEARGQAFLSRLPAGIRDRAFSRAIGIKR